LPHLNLFSAKTAEAAPQISLSRPVAYLCSRLAISVWYGKPYQIDRQWTEAATTNVLLGRPGQIPGGVERQSNWWF
jgi:hypothetical protein